MRLRRKVSKDGVEKKIEGFLAYLGVPEIEMEAGLGHFRGQRAEGGGCLCHGVSLAFGSVYIR